jgi:3-oxoacyl-[acyl-carrier-protein] synthase II
MKRVVITGCGALSPLGHDWSSVHAHLKSLRNAVTVIDEWADYRGLNTQVAARAAPFELPPERYHRKSMRSMGRVAVLATRATDLALQDAGLLDSAILKSGKVGISYGSSTGSPKAVSDFEKMLYEKSTEGITANTYIKMMSHTAPVNIGVFFGITGRIITTSSACTSGSQGIGFAFEAIQAGKQQVMVAGGSEELDATSAAVFDTLFATSSAHNHEPQLTPRPFDAARDGLVLGEGGCTLVLEELEHAQSRGATIYAELIGYGTNSDGSHVTHPNAESMAQAMRLALSDAGIPADAVDYINAHGTATQHGDVAESHATHEIFGDRLPISSLKSYMGHTLGACGALEAWMTIEMMRSGWFAPTLNLTSVDPACASLDYLDGSGRTLDAEIVVSNNFAFGGINTSLIFKRWAE